MTIKDKVNTIRTIAANSSHIRIASGYPLTLTKTLAKAPQNITVYGASGGVGDWDTTTNNLFGKSTPHTTYNANLNYFQDDGLRFTTIENGTGYHCVKISVENGETYKLYSTTTNCYITLYKNGLSSSQQIATGIDARDGYSLTANFTGNLLIRYATFSSSVAGAVATVTSAAFYGCYKIPILINPPVLPSGYTKLEYIEGTGTQFIELDFAPGGGQYKMRCKIKTTTVPTDTTYLRIFGNASVSGSPNYRFMYRGTKKVAPVCGGATNGEIYSDAWSNETVYMLEVNGIDGTYAVNGTSAAYPYKAPTESNETNIHLFKSGRGANVSAFIMYGFSVEDDSGAVIYEIIPAKRNSDGEIGMYDIVNDVFYENQGTGSFIAGAEIPNKTINLYSPAQIADSEYITVNPKAKTATWDDGTSIANLQDWDGQDWKIPKANSLTVSAGTTVAPDKLGMAYMSKDKTWRIYGASGGVGDRTVNLFDYNYFSDHKTHTGTSTLDFVEYTLKPNTVYTACTNYPHSEGDSSILNDIFFKSGTYSTPSTANNGIADNIPRSVTTDGNGKCFISFRSERAAIGDPPKEEDFASGVYWLMLVEGSYTASTMPSYEPYGYKIPIQMATSQDTDTVNIYSDAPLGDGDVLTINPKQSAMRNNTDVTDMQDWTQSWKVPKGVTGVTVDTTVQPSKFEV